MVSSRIALISKSMLARDFTRGDDFSFLRLENVLLRYQSHASCLCHGVSLNVACLLLFPFLFYKFGYQIEGQWSQQTRQNR